MKVKSVLTEIRRVHSVNGEPVVLVHIVQDTAQSVDVPLIAVVVRKTRLDVRSVNGGHILDVLPVLPL